MCGVVGLTFEKNRPDLGRIAAELLKRLEYRGYDSTGAAFQGEGTSVRLAKGVGAPSVMVQNLGIVEMGGRIFCGQVRWATFGAITDENSQPHVVGCKASIYGAHNGNVTNCDTLKTWLAGEGHRVLSDNDGEMVVHTIEHCFGLELARRDAATVHDPKLRRACMRAALVAAASRLEGSYAAVIVDPESRGLWAVKQGSSLYFGIGEDPVGGRFAIASSDLSSVLHLTRVLVPLREGEFVEYDATGYQLYAIRDRPTGAADAPPRKTGEPIDRQPKRSHLRAKDTALRPPYTTFMEQEVAAQEQVCGEVVNLFTGGDGGTANPARALLPIVDSHPPEEVARITQRLEALRDECVDERIRRLFHELCDLPELKRLAARVPSALRAVDVEAPAERVADRLIASEAGFLADLLALARRPSDLLAVRLLDALLARDEVRHFQSAVERFVDLCLTSIGHGGRLFVVCCGSSYNAARAAALFFNEIAHTDLVPLLPGEFRERALRSLRDSDLLVAVSQSGETKDLVDVLDEALATGRALRRVAIVNNVNSTLAQEKSDHVIPLGCGPEIAVPATKSFMNQMVVFYCLALRLGERRLAAMSAGESMSAAARERWAAELAQRRDKLHTLPDLIRETVRTTETEVDEAAQLLHMRPSLHLLATRLTALAREGALKIREIVLNHAEGFESSEFKHGPNTILGFNTILGPPQVDALLRRVGALIEMLLRETASRGELGPDAVHRLVQAVTDSVFTPGWTNLALAPAERALLERALDRQELLTHLHADYPLIFITGPDERDVNLTVSQINTHKIRGALTILVAEEHPALRQAASKPPSDNAGYRTVYVALPRTNDNLMVAFSATVALQRLALRMSLLKMQYLDRIGVKYHGVHPDIPKNVSKSITVD